MIGIDEKLNKLQLLLEDAYVEYVAKRRKQVSYAEFATKYLGVSAASYSQWKNGTRLPDYRNTIILARKLGQEVFDIMGYPRVPDIKDPRLRLIVDRWFELADDTKQEMYNAVMEEIGGKPTRREQ